MLLPVHDFQLLPCCSHACAVLGSLNFRCGLSEHIMARQEGLLFLSMSGCSLRLRKWDLDLRHQIQRAEQPDMQFLAFIKYIVLCVVVTDPVSSIFVIICTLHKHIEAVEYTKDSSGIAGPMSVLNLACKGPFESKALPP